MEKLSRTARYKELRDNLENESPENFSKSPNSSQTGTPSFSQTVTEESETSDGQSFVFKELEKEVRAYGQKQESPAEDTAQNEARRQSHLEPMDLNAPAGDVTTNISTVNLNSFSAPSKNAKPAYSRMNILADEQVEEDNLEVFDLGVDDFDRTIQQKKNGSSSSRPKRKNKKTERKTSKPAPQKTSIPVEEDEEDERSFSWLTFFLGLAIVVLIGSIAFMVYLIIQSGIL